VSLWRLRRERRLALHKAKVLHEQAMWMDKKGWYSAAAHLRFVAEHEEHHVTLLDSLINVSRETSS
jgi:hypothetical protein